MILNKAKKQENKKAKRHGNTEAKTEGNGRRRERSGRRILGIENKNEVG